MKRLFILFLVAIMLTGCGRRSIFKHDIEGQDAYITQQVEDEREGMSDADCATIICGIGVIWVGAAVFWANATWFGFNSSRSVGTTRPST